MTVVTNEVAAVGQQLPRTERLINVSYESTQPFSPLFCWTESASGSNRSDVKVLGRYNDSDLPSLATSQLSSGIRVAFLGSPSLLAGHGCCEL